MSAPPVILCSPCYSARLGSAPVFPGYPGKCQQCGLDSVVTNFSADFQWPGPVPPTIQERDERAAARRQYACAAMQALLTWTEDIGRGVSGRMNDEDINETVKDAFRVADAMLLAESAEPKAAPFNE